MAEQMRAPPSSTGVLSFYDTSMGGPKVGPVVVLFTAVLLIVIEILFRVF